jgi:two-component system nitrate/nitrite response regulator NarL
MSAASNALHKTIRPVRVIIGDEQALFRVALRCLLDSDSAFDVVGEGADGETLVELTRTLEPDVVLIDTASTSADPTATLHAIHDACERTRVILLTSQMDGGQIADALRAGANGVVRKDATVEILCNSINAVASGEYWVGRDRVDDLCAHLTTEPTPPESPRRYGLSAREMEILRAVVAGWTNREISKHLSISPNTAKHHLSNIFDKLGVSNRLELALFAHYHALLTDAVETPTLAISRTPPGLTPRATHRYRPSRSYDAGHSASSGDEQSRVSPTGSTS